MPPIALSPDCSASITTLLCGASGSSLSRLTERLDQQEFAVADLDNLLKADLGFSDLGAAIRKLPRARLFGALREVLGRVKETFDAQPGKPHVISAHLTWYNSGTREFFSPLQLAPLADLGITRVVVVIDDIYDMLARLRGEKDIFQSVGTNGEGRLLNELDEINDNPSLAMVRGRISALSLLITWRRAEMMLADNLATNLGPDGNPLRLVLFGLKHEFRVLRSLLHNNETCTVYLSHRIRELRGMNIDDSSFESRPVTLGDWPTPVASETGQLHDLLASRHIALICPTSIDELRFTFKNKYPYLTRRWPRLDTADHGSAYVAPSGEEEYTELFVPNVAALPNDPACIIASVRGLRDTIFFDISNRDHFIVEHIPHILVFRPFFSPSETAESADWSKGVRAECKHWSGVTTLERRALFVHSAHEIEMRLRLLKKHRDDFLTAGGVSARQHPWQDFRHWMYDNLGEMLRVLGCPKVEIGHILAGNFALTPTDQLDGDPSWLDHNRHEVLRQVGAAGHKVLTWWFTGIPPVTTANEPNESPVGLVFAAETQEDRTLSDLPHVAQDAYSAFASPKRFELQRLTLNFYAEFYPAFREVFGYEPEDLFFETLGGSTPADLLYPDSDPRTQADSDACLCGGDTELTQEYGEDRVLIYTCNEYERNAALQVFGRSGVKRIEGSDGVFWELDRIGTRRVVLQYGKQNPTQAQHCVVSGVGELQPSMVLALGICAATKPRRQRLGDVCVASSTWDGGWGSQGVALEHKGILRTLRGVVPPDLALPEWEDPATGERRSIARHDGTFITVAVKCKSQKFRKELVSSCEATGGTPVAIDMEADSLGVGLSFAGAPLYVCIKAVADYADGSEYEDPTVKASQQEQAALIAAEVAYSWLVRC